jgi:FtsZ family, C-terminal domain
LIHLEGSRMVTVRPPTVNISSTRRRVALNSLISNVPAFRPFSDHRDTAATTRSCPPGAARSFRPVDFSAIRDVFEVRREGGVPAADGGQFFPPGTFTDAFATADRVLHSGVACITDLIVKEGLIKFDFADVRAVMREMGSAMMGTGEASGDRRA